MKYIFLIFLIAGCISGDGGSSIIQQFSSVEINPQQVIIGRDAQIFLDVMNPYKYDLQNVEVKVFDIGTFSKDPENPDCIVKEDLIEPNQFFVDDCVIKAPESSPASAYSDLIRIQEKYSTGFQGGHSISIIPIETYELGDFEREQDEQTIFNGGDHNISYRIIFMDAMPLIYDKEELFFHIQLSKNNSNRLSDVGIEIKTFCSESENSGDSETENTSNCSNKIKDCDELVLIGNEFNQITCKLELDEDINYLNDETLIITIEYTYNRTYEKNFQVLNRR